MPCACQQQSLGRLGQTTTASTREVSRDVVAGAVAFGAPLIYSFTAPKRWPKLNLWQNLGAVVGLYFLATWSYDKLYPPPPPAATT